MNSRQKILDAVKSNQPPPQPLPVIDYATGIRYDNPERQFTETLKNIGGSAVAVSGLPAILPFIKERFGGEGRFVTTVNDLPGVAMLPAGQDAHQLDSVTVAVIPALLGVAENGAVWVTEAQLGERVLPFICEHLAVVLQAGSIVSNMHEAYDRIGAETCGFGVFIAGPSKTADIEQSLVLGAHGPKSMTVFLLS